MGGWSLRQKGLIKAYLEADDGDDDISNRNSSVVIRIRVNHEILTVITSFKKALSNLKRTTEHLGQGSGRRAEIRPSAVHKAGVITTATRRLPALKCCGQTEWDDLLETGTSTSCSINDTHCNDLSGTDHSKTSKQTQRLLLHGMFSRYRSATTYCIRTAIDLFWHFWVLLRIS
jgi:hypothetical protein